MRQRIDELAGAICQILQRVDELGLDTAGILKDLDIDLPLQPSSKSGTETDTPSIPGASSSFANLAVSEDLRVSLDNAPLLALLDNDVLCSEKVAFMPSVQSPISSGTHVGLGGKYSRILKDIRPLAPSSQTLSLLLRHNQLSICLFGKSFPRMDHLRPEGFDESQLEALRDYMLEAFQSEDVGTVTQVLISLATCIQQLPCGVQFGLLGLRDSLDQLQKQYMEFAEALLAPDEGIAGSVDGLDCLLAQVRFYINGGLPRKAWVIFRRAATFAQLLGSLHQSPSDQLDMRKRGLWLQMWQMDKAISLLLGLPYMLTALPFKVDSNNSTSPGLPPRAVFAFKLGEIAAKVIDRNSRGQMDASYSATLEIDQDFERCKGIMPSSWWDALPGPDMALDAIHEMFTFKFWCHNLRNYIHLPFVLKSSTDPKCYFSSMTALESSRNMIRMYEILRDSERPAIRLCNMMDFQVLTAGLIIILQLLGNPPLYALQQQEQDWQIIYGLVRVMKYAAQSVPDGVAAQAVQLLEDLSKLRYDFSGSHQSFHAVVPYFGEIRIRRRNEGFPHPLQPQQQHVSVAFPPQPGVVPQAPPQWEETINPVDAQIPLFDFNNFDFELDNSQVWPGPDQEWMSMVDFALQDGWDWDLNG